MPIKLNRKCSIQVLKYFSPFRCNYLASNTYSKKMRPQRKKPQPPGPSPCRSLSPSDWSRAPRRGSTYGTKARTRRRDPPNPIRAYVDYPRPTDWWAAIGKSYVNSLPADYVPRSNRDIRAVVLGAQPIIEVDADDAEAAMEEADIDEAMPGVRGDTDVHQTADEVAAMTVEFDNIYVGE